MSNEVENHVPLGTVGRFVGLRVIPPELQVGEKVRWSARANRLQYRVRAVGGRLYLTNHRLIFGRSRLESLLGGKEWSAPLSELTFAATAEDLLKTVRIELADGRVERFRVADRDHSAAVIDAAIREADPAVHHND